MIRPAAPADLPAIGRLGALLVRTHHDFDPERFIAATPQTERGYASFLGSQLDEPNVVILVAEHDLTVIPSPSHVIPSAARDLEFGAGSARNLQYPIGEVVGYSYCAVEGYDYMSLRGPAGALYDIVVDPIHRRRGVGRMLLEASLAALASRGAPRVVLSTAEQNEAAQRLFARAGFRRTMIEMTRELRPNHGRMNPGASSP